MGSVAVAIVSVGVSGLSGRIAFLPKFAGGVSPAIKSGSFDWTYHSIAEKIPKEATDVTIRFGLQQAAGRAFFSKLSIKLEEQP